VAQAVDLEDLRSRGAMVDDLLGGAGGLEAVLTVMALQERRAPPPLPAAVGTVGVSLFGAVSAGIAGATGSESPLLRRAAPYSIAFVALLGMVVVLASSGALGFLVAP